jgi:UDP-N-acetylmuramyl pentapeptide phosphotransferase/UDP-N-acetylglucosamine-1-phosphate transferase
MGISEISYLGSILITILVVVFIINGFNLIDGIDGLASGIGIVASLFFGIWFFAAHYISYSIMCFALAGSLIAFFWFNVFGRKNKIFLGDTGSLIIGMIISVFTIRFLEYDLVVKHELHVQSAPAIIFGVLIIPLFDTLRIIFIRVMQGRSPFNADRQHVHHRMIELGNSHLRSTIIIVSVNLFFISISIAFQSLGVLWLIILQLLLASVLSSFLVFMVNRKSTLLSR